MNVKREFDSEAKRLLKDGEELASSIESFLGLFQSLNTFDKMSDEQRQTLQQIAEQTILWFNEIKLRILPRTVYGEQSLFDTMQNLLQAIQLRERYPNGQLIGLQPTDAIKNAKRVIQETMTIIRSAPIAVSSISALQPQQRSSFVPNTAFILMWMDKTHPELDDVANAIKEICQNFDIRAFRADDIEHQERITDLILDQIRNSEFLIADLSGERPNVYYEIGFAHALGKRPILYRKEGTKLHFDLSVHNAPEYKNITELKELLTKRFEALLGRAPRSAQVK
jgi:nucleoside 2-deoxyribosyltransferase